MKRDHTSKTVRADTVYVGIDIQTNFWGISIYSVDDHWITFHLPPFPQLLKAYIDEKFPDAKVVCAYRATLHNSWIHRLLTSYDYQCLVFDPKVVRALDNGRVDEIQIPSLDSRTIGNALRNGLIESIFPEKHQSFCTSTFAEPTR